ncbi:ATP-binding protein [Myxococcus stipitatus]|uniref:ATP-binding protein n=1 Tax=Myxococcus stipitatus TaxID=83455 RepID=UPI0031454EC9
MFRPPFDSQARPQPPRSAYYHAAQDVVDLLSSSAIALRWLVRLRWHAVAGTALTVGVAARGLRLDLPVVPLLALVVLTGASNLLLTLWLRRHPVVKSHHLGAVLALDTLLLTGLLALSGGPENPFAMLYLVHVAMAALVLGPRWTLSLALLAVVGPVLLFQFHVPLRELGDGTGSVLSGPGRVVGTWVAFSLTVMSVSLMVARVSAALRDRQEALVRAQLLASRAEKLASLSTLAAGAAHELGTPLGTIAIAANELDVLIQEEPQEALEDARLIRDQVERCRDILERMSARAGQTYGEAPEQTTTSAVLERMREELTSGELARVRVEEATAVALYFPPRGLVQVLVNLVRNALHASEATQAPVLVRVMGDGSRTRFVVEDRGTGIPRDVLERVGEPFFTTKPAGQGMGLGLFLGQTFAELCGGRLELASEEGLGTRATLELPCRKGAAHVAA